MYVCSSNDGFFQFHKGTIKTSISYDVEDGAPTFNSIKVQLRLMRLAPMPFPTFFQFHKGTIKTLFKMQDFPLP